MRQHGFAEQLQLLLALLAPNFQHDSTDSTHVSTTAILAGVVSFGLCYGAYLAIFHAIFGLPASLYYALSLPIASLVAHYYLRGLRRFAVSARCAWVLLRAPTSARHLLALRNALIAEIDAARWLVPAEALTHDQEGSP